MILCVKCMEFSKQSINDGSSITNNNFPYLWNDWFIINKQ